MKLNEWKDGNGNKIGQASSATAATMTKTNKDKFISLLYYIMRNRGSQVLDSKVLGLNDTGFTYRELRKIPTGQEELIAVVIFTDDRWHMSIYKNGKCVDNYAGESWETLLEALEGYYNVPVSGTKEYDKLCEWLDSKGNKVSISSSTPTTSTSIKNNVDQTDRYKSLVAQIDADGISTYTLNDLNATELNITVNRPNNKTLDIKIIYDPATDTYTLRMLGRELKGCDYKKDILELLVIGKIIKDTNLCESALNEFVDKNGKKINLNNSAAQTTNKTSTKNYPDQTERYKKLLAQIDSDGFCKYTINILDDRILAITLNNGVGVKIIFKPYVPCYLVQVDGYDNNCDTFEDVLKLLIIEGIIGDTDLCESTSFADDFKIYEDMWN